MKNEPSDFIGFSQSSVVQDQKLSGTSHNPIVIDLSSPDIKPKYDPTKYRLNYTDTTPKHSKDAKSHMRAMLGLTTTIFSMSNLNKTSPKQQDDWTFEDHVISDRSEQSSSQDTSQDTSLTLTSDNVSSLDASLIITSEIPPHEPQTANQKEVKRSHDPSPPMSSPPSTSSQVKKESFDTDRTTYNSTKKRARQNAILQVPRKRKRPDNQEYDESSTTPSVAEEDEIKFIPFTGRPRSHVPAGPHTDVGIFWDIENLRVPPHIHPASLVTELRKRVVDCQPHFREAIFYVVCDVYRENKSLINQLFEFHVRVVHVPGTKQNTSDNVLRDLMVEFVGHHAGKSPRVVLLSGDSDFSHDIYNFTRKEKCDVVLVHNPQAKDSMIKSASSAFLFQSLFPSPTQQPAQHFERSQRSEVSQHSETSQQSYDSSNNLPQYPQYANNHRFYNAPQMKPRRFPTSPAASTTFLRLPDYVPIQTRAQAFYSKVKKKMLGKGRTPVKAKRMGRKQRMKCRQYSGTY